MNKKIETVDNKRNNMEESGMHPLAGGVIGAVVGAVVGTFVASLLSDKENRDKAIKIFEDIKDRTVDALKEANDKPNGLQTVVKEVIDEKVDEVGEKYLN